MALALQHDAGDLLSKVQYPLGSILETVCEPPPPPGISPYQTRSQVQTQCPLPHSLHFSGGSFCTLYASLAFVM